MLGCTHNGASYVFRKDLLGNIIQILDSVGNVVVKYEYDAWGNHTVLGVNDAEITDSNHIGRINLFRYRGYTYDESTGLYYLLTRFYDPETGRFLNMDTLEYAEPTITNGLNLYAYGLNNPIMYVDPTGHFVLSAWMVGALVGFGVSFASSLVSQVLTGESLADGKVWAIAAIDGDFGALSGALGGASFKILNNPFVSGAIDAGITFVNS